jgi:hypothetical protein
MADGREGGKLEGKMSIYINDATKPDRFMFDINGTAIPEDKVTRRYLSPVGDDGLLNSGIRYEVPLEGCPAFCGDNELGITWLEKNRLVAGDPWMEILSIDIYR